MWQYLKESIFRPGVMLAIANGLLLTTYSALLHNTKNDVNKNTVLLFRSIIQIMGMAIWGWYKNLSFVPNVPKEKRLSSWILVFCTISTVYSRLPEKCEISYYVLCALQNWHWSAPFTFGNFLPAYQTDTFLHLAFAASYAGFVTCVFQAWQMLPIACVQSITQCTPVIVLILSHFAFDDRMTLIRSFCCGSFIIGLFLEDRILEYINAHGHMVSCHILFAEINCCNAIAVQNKRQILPMFYLICFYFYIFEDFDFTGYIITLTALALLSLAIVFTKLMTGMFAKSIVMCYTGMGMLVAATFLLLLLPSNDVPTLPSSAIIWTESIVIAVMSILTQIALVCKYPC